MLKAGRHAGGEKAVKTHSGMSAVPDTVFEAANRRAGVVRVKNIGHPEDNAVKRVIKPLQGQ